MKMTMDGYDFFYSFSFADSDDGTGDTAFIMDIGTARGNGTDVHTMASIYTI